MTENKSCNSQRLCKGCGAPVEPDYLRYCKKCTEEILDVANLFKENQ